MSFSSKLKSLRTENNMTQQYVAEQLNVSRSTIAGYETKDRQPSHEGLTALADFFHVTVDYLLDIASLSSADAPCSIREANEKELISQYRSLSPESKEKLNEYLRLLELKE